MKNLWLFSSLLTCLLVTGPAARAQQFEQMPSGQTVWIPQRQHIPARPYYPAQGGAPIGTVIQNNGVQTFVPYNNQPPSRQGEE
jgi:hypothetical protein